MGKKQKSEFCSTGWCSNHLLEIHPLKSSDCYYKKKIKLRLCPKHNTLTNSFQKSMPIVNKDSKHYTPCFILEDEQSYYHNNDQKLLSTHQHKLEEDPSCTIMVAKHGRKKNYCSVCRIEYQDYLTHIQDISHKQQLRSNRFSKLINETELKMRPQKKVVPQSLVQPQPIFIEIKVLQDTKQPQSKIKQCLNLQE